MPNYKDFDKTHIGYSDIATLILAGMKEDRSTLNLQPLNFGSDGDYYAYIVYGEATIGAHYKEVATFASWLRVYDDEGLCGNYHAPIIKVYQAGEFHCIIQLLDKEK